MTSEKLDDYLRRQGPLTEIVAVWLDEVVEITRVEIWVTVHGPRVTEV